MNRSPRTRIRAVCALMTAVVAGCAPPARPASTPGLSADSAAALRAALPLVRPAYGTQAEAVAAGVYAAPSLAAAPPPPAAPPAPADPPAPAREPVREPTTPSAPPLAAVTPLGSPLGSPLESPAPAAAWEIQIAAFRDSASAALIAAEARSRFPDLEARVRAEPPLFRVSLTGWATAALAEAVLDRVRAAHPSAWVRQAVP